METLLTIGGMHCGGCASSVEKALKADARVTVVVVDRDSGTARVTHEGAPFEALVAAVEDAGFDASAA